MAFAKNSMLFFMVLALFGVCFGTVYKVGDSNGWTDKGSVSYKDWASTKNFVVGDAIVFEYNAKEQNVVQVKTLTEFNGCNSKAPLSTYNSGNDAVELKKAGHFFYICGLPGHCEAGQKVDIRVLEPSQAPSPSHSSPSPSPAPSSNHSHHNESSAPVPSPSAKAPTSPNKSSAPSVKSSSGLNLLVFFAVQSFISAAFEMNS
ncbi:Cupredoxin superfamily protein [Prunus dulcis]|uniref:Cupredoxin superfamily protein n=1 Tax=Prunus dulcis TaxID=3755 RepID=A0A4Y1S2C6_PRUDU|nr:Cupredoxin superfamily protein [Prunus dulcis]